MRDVLGWRKLLGAIGPSTNTVVQPDYDMMRPAGVTNHYSRIFTPNAGAVSNETFASGIEVIRRNTMEAVRSVMTCEPDYLVMGMSAITFFDGRAGADRFVREIFEETGLGISVGSHSCDAALRAYGGVKRIAFLTPYWPVMNEQVARYFTEMGYSVVRDIALKRPSWTGIAHTTPKECVEAIKYLDGDDVDAIVQVGTNLSMVKLAVMAEMWLGKPVIAINAATYWHALRACGIEDKVAGCGRLREEF